MKNHVHKHDQDGKSHTLCGRVLPYTPVIKPLRTQTLKEHNVCQTCKWMLANELECTIPGFNASEYVNGWKEIA